MKLELSIYGQIRGGKNNMQMTRTGRHYPNPEWARYRDRVVRQLKEQVKGVYAPISVPCRVSISYWKGDLRKRDVPAILDSIWHCLERAEIIEDDCLIEDVDFSNIGLDREDPRVDIILETK